MTALDPVREGLTLERQIPLWDAVNAYAEACGGNTGAATVSEARMRAVVKVNRAVGAILAALVAPKLDPVRHWAEADRERFLHKLVAVKTECGNAVGNAKRRQFDQGVKWLGLRIQEIIRSVGEPGQLLDDDYADLENPAWFRGNDRGVDGACEALEKVLAGERTGTFGGARLEALAQKIRNLVSQLGVQAPGPLQWTKEKPTREGYYRSRHPGGEERCIVELRSGRLRANFSDCSIVWIEDAARNREWLGPLPEPGQSPSRSI